MTRTHLMLVLMGLTLVWSGCTESASTSTDASSPDAREVVEPGDAGPAKDTAPDLSTPDTTQDLGLADTQAPLDTAPADIPCVPDCEGKSCGDNGCDGVCGSCGPHATCEAGACVGTCAGACGLYDPDATCQCNAECAAFDDCCDDACEVCSDALAAMCAPCTPSCEGKGCGAEDGCGGACTGCPEGSQTTCVAGICVNAAYSCAGKCGAVDLTAPCSCAPSCFETGDCCSDVCKACGDVYAADCDCEKTCDLLSCGPDGCGGSCGTCGPGQICSDGGCVADDWGCNGVGIQGCCNDGHLIMCDFGAWAIEDCGGACGWEGNWAGGFYAGAYQCGVLGADPSGLNPLHCDAVCTPQCDKKTCGDNGCGYVCGTCGDAEVCEEGQCVPAPVCDEPVGDLDPPAADEIEDTLKVVTLDELPGDLEPTVYGSLDAGNICAPDCTYPLMFHQLDLYFLNDEGLEVFLELRQLNPAGTGYRLLRHVTYEGGPTVVGYHFENLGMGSTETYMSDGLLDAIGDLADQAGDYALPCDSDACLEDVEYSYVETFFMGCEVDRYHVVFEQWIDVGIVNQVIFVLDTDFKLLEVGGGLNP